MSFGRHAYRHALQQQPATSFLDHVWISEEHLASAFRRFANCQRRHESQVPGPLEARRRLAKRKNTAVASIGASGPPVDVGSLFGVNGGGHMQWNDSPRTRSSKKPPDISFYPTSPLEPFLPDSFHKPKTSVNDLPASDPSVEDHGNANAIMHNGNLKKMLQNSRTVQVIKRALAMFGVDLQREPACSQVVFHYLLSNSKYSANLIYDEVILFLDDPALNPPGAGNYLALVEHLQHKEVTTAQRHKILSAVERAVELGLISGTEITQIVKMLGSIKINLGGTTVKMQEDPAELFGHLRRIWDALRGCKVLRLRDLDQGIVEEWLYQLVTTSKQNEDPEDLLLAKDIVLEAQAADSSIRHWIPVLIRRCVRASVDSTIKDSWFGDRTHVANYVNDLLGPLDVDLAARYLIQISEDLAFEKDDDDHRRTKLVVWRECLRRIPDAASVASSRVWVHLDPFDSLQSLGTGARDSSIHYRVVLRLWLLAPLSRKLHRDDVLWFIPHPKITDPLVCTLLRQFDRLTSDHNEADFFGNLIEAIQELKLPYNGILAMVYSVLTMKKVKNPRARRAFERLETSQTTLVQVVMDRLMFNATKAIFYPTFERLIRKIDVSSLEFLEDSIRMVDSGRRGCFDVLRLLACHVPLKIALNLAWPRTGERTALQLGFWPAPPEQDQQTEQTEQQQPTESSDYTYPDPGASLQIINLLALYVAGTDKLRASYAFEMVHYLYRFLIRHNAPVQPSVVRALYHSGVVRYRREGRHVPPDQYQYIMEAVRKWEGPEVVEILEGIGDY